jgi:hypothetical protein
MKKRNKVTKKKKKVFCSICQNPYFGDGNNAQPINKGRCCDTCNLIVISARFNLIYNKLK